jgi:soluble lytic murein transglycosylase-like protein
MTIKIKAALLLVLILVTGSVVADKGPGHEAELTAYVEDFLKPISRTREYRHRMKAARKIIPVIVEQSWAHNVDPLLAAVIISFESSWEPSVMGAKGDTGYMQVMPGRKRHKGEDLKDPKVNISAGVEVLSECIKDCPNDLEGALSRYGTGGACRPLAGFVGRRMKEYKKALKKYRGQPNE